MVGKAQFDLKAEGNFVSFQVYILVEHWGEFSSVGDCGCGLAVHDAHGGDLDDPVALRFDASGLQVEGDEGSQGGQVCQVWSLDLPAFAGYFFSDRDLFRLHHCPGAPHTTGQGHEKIRVPVQNFPDLMWSAAQADFFDDSSADLPLD